MSNVSDRHQIVPFISGKTKPLSDQRLAVVSYKLTKEDKAKGLTEKSKQSVCASIPVFTAAMVTPEAVEAFKPYLVQMIQDTQDKIVREFADVGVSTVADADLSIASVLTYLDEESKGSRLTKESITEWFNASVQDMLAVAFAEKMGLSDTPSEDDTKKLEQQLNVYREKFASLAGGKTSFPPEIAVKLIKALEFAPTDDLMAQRFTSRLEKMKEIPTADMLAL